jgi:hypothetical protein
MAPVFRSIARLFTALAIALGVRPRFVSLLDLLQRPPVQIVAITRRRRLDYESLFAAELEAYDQAYADSSAAQPGPEAGRHPPSHRPARRRYTPVRSA